MHVSHKPLDLVEQGPALGAGEAVARGERRGERERGSEGGEERFVFAAKARGGGAAFAASPSSSAPSRGSVCACEERVSGGARGRRRPSGPRPLPTAALLRRGPRPRQDLESATAARASAASRAARSSARLAASLSQKWRQ